MTTELLGAKQQVRLVPLAQIRSQFRSLKTLDASRVPMPRPLDFYPEAMLCSKVSLLQFPSPSHPKQKYLKGDHDTLLYLLNRKERKRKIPLERDMEIHLETVSSLIT